MSRLRVVHHLCRAAGDDEDLLAHTAAARMAPGCEEAECYRAFERRENVAVLELWSDEFAYSERWRALVNSGEAFKTVLRSSAERSYGRNGSEFYWQQIYTIK